MSCGIQGHWDHHTAGGNFRTSLWRLNRQYIFKHGHRNSLSIELEQIECFHHIGFYVLYRKERPAEKQYRCNQENLAGQSPFTASQVVSLTLDDAQTGYYIILPCTLEPHLYGKFTLHIPSYRGRNTIRKLPRGHVTHLDGSWVTSSAGGCNNYPTFSLNPIFSFSIPGEKALSLLAIVSQDEQDDFDFIGFYIFNISESLQVPDHRKHKSSIDSKDNDNHHFSTNSSIPIVSQFDNSREAIINAQLTPGQYLLVPTTFTPHHEGRFTVQLCSNIFIDMTEVKSKSKLSPSVDANNSHYSDQYNLSKSAPSPSSDYSLSSSSNDKSNYALLPMLLQSEEIPSSTAYKTNTHSRKSIRQSLAVFLSELKQLKESNMMLEMQLRNIATNANQATPQIQVIYDQDEAVVPFIGTSSSQDYTTQIPLAFLKKTNLHRSQSLSFQKQPPGLIKPSQSKMPLNLANIVQSPSLPVPTLPEALTTLSIQRVGTDNTIFGAWQQDTAGGSISSIDWYSNPQFMLHVFSLTTIEITLTQDPDIQGNNTSVCFYLIRSGVSGGRNLIWLHDPEQDILFESSFNNKRKGVSWASLKLDPTPSNDPYILVLATILPNQFHSWTLKIQSNVEIKISSIDPPMRWKEISIDGEWAGPLSGGCRNHPTFFNNNQYLLTLDEPVSRFDFCMLLYQTSKAQFDPISIYLISASSYFDSNISQSHKINVLNPDDIIQPPKFSDSHVYYFQPSHEVLAGSYIVIPTTFAPYQDSKFTLKIFTMNPHVHLKSLSEQAHLPQIISGEWKQLTAAGCLNNLVQFKHNNQYELSLDRDHDLFIKQIQYPLKQSASPSPPVSHGFYIFNTTFPSCPKFNNILKNDIVCITPFTTKHDVSTVQHLKAGQYLIVPCTFDAKEEARYEVTIFSHTNYSQFYTIGKLLSFRGQYRELHASGKWDQSSSGGCYNHFSWIINPQFLLSITTRADIAIFLHLKRFHTKEELDQLSSIGFYVLKHDPQHTIRLDPQMDDLIYKSPFRRINQVSVHFLANSGVYNIVPTTFYPERYADFELVIFLRSTDTEATLIACNHGVVSFTTPPPPSQHRISTNNDLTTTEEMPTGQINNPMFYLSVLRSIKMVVILVSINKEKGSSNLMPSQSSSDFIRTTSSSSSLLEKKDDTISSEVAFLIAKCDVQGDPCFDINSPLFERAPFEVGRDAVMVLDLLPSLTPCVFILNPSGPFHLYFVFDPAFQDQVIISPLFSKVNVPLPLSQQQETYWNLCMMQQHVSQIIEFIHKIQFILTQMPLDLFKDIISLLETLSSQLQLWLNQLESSDLFSPELKDRLSKLLTDTLPTFSPAINKMLEPISSIVAMINQEEIDPKNQLGAGESAPHSIRRVSSKRNLLSPHPSQLDFPEAPKESPSLSSLSPSKLHSISHSPTLPENHLDNIIQSVKLKPVARRSMLPKQKDRNLVSLFSESFDKIVSRRKFIQPELEDDTWD